MNGVVWQLLSVRRKIRLEKSVIYSCSDTLPCEVVLDRFWMSRSLAEPALRCRA